MSRMNLASCFLFLFCVLGSPVFAQTEVVWETDLEAAMAKSKSDNKPLLVTMHTSTEIACQRMLKNLYTDPDVIAKLQDFVVVPTCVDAHKESEKTIDGEKKRVSDMFRTIGCKELIKNERDVKERFFEKNDVKVPNHIFVDVEGKIFMKKIYELKKPAFLDLLDRALVQFGAKVVDGMDAPTQALFEQVKKGNLQEKEKAVKAILEFQNEKKTETLYMTIQGLKKESDRAACIRAMGSDAMTHAAPIAMKWLTDKSPYIKNCAVVTLEEMKHTEAVGDLVTLFEKTRKGEKDLRKDILRALGPCGAGEPKAQEILLKHVKDKKEPMRVASYMSLGHFLEDKTVQDTLQKRWKKDAKGVAPRTAIIYAYSISGDADLIPQLDGLLKGEKNHQLLLIAESAKKKMRGEQGGGGRDKKAGRGAGRALRKAWKPLYAKDKIVRNRIKEWNKR